MAGGNGGKNPYNQNSLLVNRPLSATGLPPVGSASASDILIMPNASLVSPVDYYVEALEGERLLIARVIVDIIANTDIDVLEYGDIGGGLTNGIQIFYRRSGITIDVSGKLSIKYNEHWGRQNYDSEPVLIGPTLKSPVWKSRWTFTRYGNPYGIILEEGDRIGVRIRDDLSSLLEHTIFAEGTHLGTPNPAWTTILT